MKLKLFAFIVFIAFISCKKEKTDPLTLLTKRPWIPTYTINSIPNISTFNECELGDSYSFSANALTITKSANNCMGLQRSFSNFEYTVDFTSNTITTINQGQLNISKLTTDSLVIYYWIDTGIKRQFVLVH
jgi:hypothetical protein